MAPRMKSKSAMNARNAINIAATFSARCSPSDAPLPAASITFTCSLLDVDLRACPASPAARVSGRASSTDTTCTAPPSRSSSGSRPGRRRARCRRPSRRRRCGHTADHHREQLRLRHPGHERLDDDRRLGLAHEDVRGAPSVSAPLVRISRIIARAISRTTNWRMPK